MLLLSLVCVCGCRDASEEESSRFAFAETRKLSGVKNEIAFLLLQTRCIAYVNL